MERDRAFSPYNYVRRGEFLRKPAAASGSEQEQPLIKVVTVKFGGAWGVVEGIKSEIL